MRWKSIVQENPDRCFLCGRTTELEKHHIFGGTANRKLSEADGLYVSLCRSCHTGGRGVHFDKNKMQSLHERGEKAYLFAGHTVDDFRKRYGRNYL